MFGTDIHHKDLNWDHIGCRRALQWLLLLNARDPVAQGHKIYLLIPTTVHFLHFQLNCDGNREDLKNFLVFRHLSINKGLKTWEPKFPSPCLSPSPRFLDLQQSSLCQLGGPWLTATVSLHTPVVTHGIRKIPQQVFVGPSGEFLTFGFSLKLKHLGPPWHRTACTSIAPFTVPIHGQDCGWGTSWSPYASRESTAGSTRSQHFLVFTSSFIP